MGVTGNVAEPGSKESAPGEEDEVAEIIVELKAAGYLEGDQQSVSETALTNAVRALQADARIPVSGELDQQTRGLFGNK